MENKRKRYVLLVIAALVNFPTGSAAIWAVFQPYARELYQLDMGAANVPFSVFMSAFVLGNIAAGRLQLKMQARKLIWLSSLVMCIGFLTTAVVPTDMPWMLSLTYGLLGGAGAGATYNVIIAVISKWFPDKRGLAAGIIVCMVGAHGFIMSPICNMLLTSFGFAKAMLIVAVIFSVVIAAGSWMITEPPKGYMSDVKIAAKVSVGKDYTAKEMIATKKFYFVAGTMAFGTMTYFLINPMVKSLGAERGLSDAMAVSAVMFVSISNCAGRLIVPTLSDKFGRKPMIFALLVLNMAAILGLLGATGIVYIGLVGAIAFVYGGIFGIFPVVVSDQFGTKNSGLNYGIVMIGYGIVCLICPFLVSVGVTFSLIAAAVSCAAGMLMVKAL